MGAIHLDRGTVVGKAGALRSYLVQIPTTWLRRNRRHLVSMPNVTLEQMLTENRVIEDSDVVQPSQTSPSFVCTPPFPPGTVMTVTPSGQTSVPPKRPVLRIFEQSGTRLTEGHNNPLRRDCNTRWKSTIYQRLLYSWIQTLKWT